MVYPRIKNLREDHDYKQRQVSEYLSCSQSVYSDYERGMLQIPISALIKLADLYKVSVDYILGRTDKKEVNT